MNQPIKKKEKGFDAVKMMREIRDQLSREMMHMTRDEQLAYIRKLAAESKRAKARS
ncbi:MAG: hypothetical protein IPM59_10710 [Chloracidobacterium sp.]|nr:hypothetical protein [Chloracidobacterium sp.]